LFGLPILTVLVGAITMTLDVTCSYCGGSWAWWTRGDHPVCNSCRKEIDRRIWSLTATSTPTPTRRDSGVR
jgi:predicted amidophosphoribosyltransferase